MSDGYSLYFVRHAIAEDRGEAYPDDSLRPLSSKGKARFQKVARGLASLNLTFDHILSSPLVRARQTAEILNAEIPGRPEIEESAALAPGGSYEQLTIALESCSRFSSIALVGHEPSIGEIAGRLAGMRGPIEFKKGAVCRIDVETLPPAGAGRLRWLAPPKMLAKLSA